MSGGEDLAPRVPGLGESDPALVRSAHTAPLSLKGRASSEFRGPLCPESGRGTGESSQWGRQTGGLCLPGPPHGGKVTQHWGSLPPLALTARRAPFPRTPERQLGNHPSGAGRGAPCVRQCPPAWRTVYRIGEGRPHVPSLPARALSDFRDPLYPESRRGTGESSQ